MKICFVGLGSIGKRHINNFSNILYNNNVGFHIDALRNSNSALDNNICKLLTNTYYKFEDLPNDYDVIFITNPTYLHYETIKKLVDKTKHMFIEKPVFDNVSCNISDIPLKHDGISK